MTRLALLLLFLAASAAAEPGAIVLVAKPGLPDPNFSETVILVTQSSEGNPIGVILNRPTNLRVRDIAPRFPGAQNYAPRVYAGGPVMREVLVALYATSEPPAHAAFEVLPRVYLTLHPANIEALLAAPSERARIYAGFSGWAPEQLEAEIDSGSWYVLRASEALLFRADTTEMWSELVAKLGGGRAGRESATAVAAR